MPTIIPDGFAVAAVTFTGPVGTEPYVTTFGVSLVGIAQEDYVDMANDIMGAYELQFSEFTSEELRCTKVTLQVGLGGGVSGSVDSSDPEWAGGGLGARVPTAMAVIARKSTADLGRAGRGRSFLPGLLSAGAVDESGNIALATAATYSERWNNLIVYLATKEVGTATPMVLLHNDGSTPTPVIAGSVAPKVGWIRKRIR